MFLLRLFSTQPWYERSGDTRHAAALRWIVLITWEELEFVAESALSRERLRDAESTLLCALTLAHDFGESDCRYLFTLEQLADVSSRMKKFHAAEDYLTRLLHIKLAQLGAEHFDIAETLHSLAGVKYNQGKYSECEELCLRSLELYQQYLGDKHIETAFVGKDLALVYHTQFKYTQAAPIYAWSLAVMESVLGTEHEEVRRLQFNLDRLLAREKGIRCEKDSLEYPTQPFLKKVEAAPGKAAMISKKANPCFYNLKPLPGH